MSPSAVVQNPPPGSSILRCAGGEVVFALRAGGRAGSAFVRTNLGGASVHRDEVIANCEEGRPFVAADWSDVPMVADGKGGFTAKLRLDEVGYFSAKAFFVPEDGGKAVWPEGRDVKIKVAPAFSSHGNSIYTAFVRQFQDESRLRRGHPRQVAELDAQGYEVIPGSGTLRELARRLDHIVGTLGFHIVQLLPIHPVPTTYARMGRFGSPFASLDFYSVDPALAEFDGRTTPLEQFVELADAVHARNARLFIDLPANHTGWASTFQLKHPEWFKRNPDGSFKSPGAWGVTWADLVELDYSNQRLRSAMADVFLFWCAHGVDGFRCDAGYMVPADVWRYITARVRKSYPDTVFMLEGLGGKLCVTDELLTEANLDWAYSEIFQEEDRRALESYLPSALSRSLTIGPLVNFAETHDNNRIAARGHAYAKSRTSLAALFSQQGAFGITAGVEWFCADKIDVHEARPLNWGASENQVAHIARLNAILDNVKAFHVGAEIRLVGCRAGNVVAALRRNDGDVFVAVNLDASNGVRAEWEQGVFDGQTVYDLISGAEIELSHSNGWVDIWLEPGQAVALVRDRRLLNAVEASRTADGVLRGEPAAEACAVDGTVATWRWPADLRRTVMVAPGQDLLVKAHCRFIAELVGDDGATIAALRSSRVADGAHEAVLRLPAKRRRQVATLKVVAFDGVGSQRGRSPVLLLPDEASFGLSATRRELLADDRIAVLANRRGAMAQVSGRWGEVRSQYDALLAINPNPAIPDNRMVFFTRCKAWVRNRDYSFELDASCTEAFGVADGGREAWWRFRTPIGMGRETSFVFRLLLGEASNCANLRIERDGDGDGPVTLILRPDVEARGFHSKTLAYTGPEKSYPSAVRCEGNGFSFDHHGMPKCGIFIDGGAFHCEPKWSYQVWHPVDEQRGLGKTGDLFSPGWFETEIRRGEARTLVAGVSADLAKVRCGKYAPRGATTVGEWLATNPLGLYIADRDELKTVIAGYPWFLDWGRDTLIFLRGMIAAGRIAESLAVIREFGRFEENGTLPNIIVGERAQNRDTVDAPLWYAVAVRDAMDRCGIAKVANLDCGGRAVRDVVVSIVRNYIAGTPNGIRVDAASGLVFSPPHFTWMDTNYPAATPRCGYPIEIQALWISALELVRRKFRIGDFADVEARARESLAKFYMLPDGFLADSLRAESGQPAGEAVAEDALRPNQLLAITLGAVPRGSEIAKAVVRACEQLLVPGGIRSLADRPVRVAQPVHGAHGLLNDPMNPYWGVYGGDEDTRRKPAYHNGTAWGWQFPLYCEAMVLAFGDDVRPIAKSLLESTSELLGRGCIGQLPEIMDGDAPHAQRGCLAQAWSMSELVRVHRLLADVRRAAGRS